MARKLWVYFEAGRAPDRARLQAQIKASGLRLVVDDGYVPFETAGYLPCTLEGEDAGVDLRFESEGEWPTTALALAGERGERRALARLAWGGDPREEVSALAVAAALAQAAQGLVLDPDKGTLLTADALMVKAKALAADNL